MGAAAGACCCSGRTAADNAAKRPAVVFRLFSLVHCQRTAYHFSLVGIHPAAACFAGAISGRVACCRLQTSPAVCVAVYRRRQLGKPAGNAGHAGSHAAGT